MAYGLIYTLEFRDKLPTGSAVYNIYIYKDGYGGASSALKATDNPLIISYKKQDLFSALIGSEATINFFSETAYQFSDFFTATPMQYQVAILRGGSVIWRGVNITDTYSESWSTTPYPISLKFNCGLGELKWHRFENAGSLYTGYEQVIQMISNAMESLPYNLTLREIVNIREDTMSDSQGLFRNLYLSDISLTEIGDDGLVHGISCAKLLNTLLTALGCRMYQSSYLSTNAWIVERISERSGTSLVYYDYTLLAAPTTSNAFTTIGTGTFNVAKNIDNANYPKIVVGGELSMSEKFPVMSVELDTSEFDNTQIISNPYFENKPNAVSSAGLPLRWDLSAQLVTDAGATQPVIKVIDRNQKNDRYRWGLSFGSTAIASQQSYQHNEGKKQSASQTVTANAWAANPIYSWTGNPFYSFLQRDYIQSVQRTGDIKTHPWLYIDPVNGSLDCNFRGLLRITITPDSLGTSYTDSFGVTKTVDAMGHANIIFSSIVLIPVQIMLYDSSANSYNYYGYTTSSFQQNTSGTSWQTGWKKNDSLGSSVAFIAYTFSDLCAMFPTVDQNGAATSLNYTTFQSIIQNVNTGTIYDTGSVTFSFLYNQSLNISLGSATFGANSGIYSARVRMFPALMQKDYPAGIATTILNDIAITDHCVGATDIQYKDSSQSTNAYNKFYSTGEESSRWNQKNLTVKFGDNVTAGYPGAFRLSTAAQTGTWHTRGGVDTGTELMDIVFKKLFPFVANYKRQLSVKLISNAIDFCHSIVDTDGKVYMQLGNTMNIKEGTYDIEMIEMAQSVNPITVKNGKSKVTTPVNLQLPIKVNIKKPIKSMPVKHKPLGKSSATAQPIYKYPQ